MHLNFKITTAVKKAPKAKIQTVRKNSIRENVQMVVHFDENEQTYFVTDLNGIIRYEFTKESFNVQNGTYYSKELVEGRNFCIITTDKVGNNYLPFAPGLIVMGDLVFEDNSLKFNFIEVTKNKNDISKDAFIKFKKYKENASK